MIAGLIGIYVGSAQLFFPIAFESSAGINLGGNASLLNEIRAAGGTLFVAGILIFSGAFISGMTFVSIVLTTLFYSAYGWSRVVGMVADGFPNEPLMIAAAAELILGLCGAFILYGFRKGKGIV
ncbi:hypothetical protein GCM10027347_07120 [Larkinella harenae]